MTAARLSSTDDRLIPAIEAQGLRRRRNLLGWLERFLAQRPRRSMNG